MCRPPEPHLTPWPTPQPAALLGEQDRAVSLFLQAHAEKWRFGSFTHLGVAVERLRGYEPFEEFLRPKG